MEAKTNQEPQLQGTSCAIYFTTINFILGQMDSSRN